MNSKYVNIIIIIIILSVSLVLSCPGPSDTDTPPGESDDYEVTPPENVKVFRHIRPPENVEVEREHYDLFISWDAVHNAYEYKVFRRYGENGIFIFLATTENTCYWDREGEYDPTRLLQYQVISVGRWNCSEPAQSNIVSNYVQNVKAGMFESVNSITISWDIHPEEPDSYRIYRYMSLDEEEIPVLICNSTVNYFTDTFDNVTGLPAPETPYYYRVSWVKDEEEFGFENAHFSFGIYSSTIDNNETGEDKEDARIIEKYAPALDACIYSFGDGNGGVIADVDWYAYIKEAGDPETINVIIHLPSDGSLDGYLKINLYDGEIKINEEPIDLFYVNGGQECFLNLSETSVSGYVEIFTTFDSGSSVLEGYGIELE